MYCTSLGKAILANLEPADQELLISRMHFKPRTANTILSGDALKAELEKVQIRGYAMDFREVEEHMVCVGAPVFDRDAKVLGAISVSSPVSYTHLDVYKRQRFAREIICSVMPWI